MILKSLISPFIKVGRFYYEGFRSMTLGKTLWAIIIIKLFVMFAILKVFFFPNFFKGKTVQETEQYVGTELVDRANELN